MRSAILIVLCIICVNAMDIKPSQVPVRTQSTASRILGGNYGK